MDENISELRVVQHRRDGRRQYDQADKRALVHACLKPGVSVARTAQTYGVNANLLRKWIAHYLLEREQTDTHRAPEPGLDVAADQQPTGGAEHIEEPATPRSSIAVPPPAFVPVVTAPLPSIATSGTSLQSVVLHVRLPNGVELDLRETNIEALTTILQMLGRLPCSGSTIA